MMLQIPLRRVATLVLVAALAVFLVPGVVLAHAELETATPADKSTVTEPITEVSGVYSEAMTPDGSSLIVKDADNVMVAQGTVDPEDDTRMVAIATVPLGNGTYTVESTAQSTDNHSERTTWTFTVALAATPSPAPTASPTPAATAAPSVAPTAAPATPLPTVAPTPGPSADGSATGSGGDVILPIVVALIILGGGAAYLLNRRNRPPDPQ